MPDRMTLKIHFAVWLVLGTAVYSVWIYRDFPMTPLPTASSVVRKTKLLPPENILPLSDPTTRPSPDNSIWPTVPEQTRYTPFNRSLARLEHPALIGDETETVRWMSSPAKPVASARSLAMGQWYLLAEPGVLNGSDSEHSDPVRLCVVNATSKALAFESSDGALQLEHEAMNAAGEWKRISGRRLNHEMRGICGNSFYNVVLPPGHFWSFPVPQYAGPVKTPMRFKLTAGQRVTYSNEFEGWIVPSLIEYVDETDDVSQHPAKPETDWSASARRLGFETVETETPPPFFGSVDGRSPLGSVTPVAPRPARAN